MMQVEAYRVYTMDRSGKWHCRHPGLRSRPFSESLAFRRYETTGPAEQWTVSYPTYALGWAVRWGPVVAVGLGALASVAAVLVRTAGL